MSSTGNMLGTVAYIAPEIATTTEADARSDIYSVGIMLYEMLTVPCRGQTRLPCRSPPITSPTTCPAHQPPNRGFPEKSTTSSPLSQRATQRIAQLDASEVSTL